MPGKRQRVLTIREKVYNDVKDRWEKKKQELTARYNVTTLTGYAQVLIERALRAEESEARFEIVNRFENHTMVRDYFLVRDADVVIRSGGSGRFATVYCELDRTGKCPHVGVVLSDPEVVERAKDYGLVLRRVPRSVPMDESLRIFEEALEKAGGEEVSEKRFADTAEKEGYEDEEGAREMLRDLCASGDARVTREAGGVHFFTKV
ncbi:MAG: hypothetical protein JRN07_04065 [Nitrososphaerota archaeon]|nr:hypothetical protein [Nitrososphaerota archaeon]